MSDEPEERMNSELSAGETLLWAGRPCRGIVFRAADLLLVPFSLAWAGGATFFEVTAIWAGAPLLMTIGGSLFVLVGLYITVGRFLIDAWQRRRTYYGVTTERIIVISNFFGRRMKSLNLDSISDLALTERRSGAGAITFGPLPIPYWFFGRADLFDLDPLAIPKFELATAARQVYELIRSAQWNAKQRN